MVRNLDRGLTAERKLNHSWISSSAYDDYCLMVLGILPERSRSFFESRLKPKRKLRILDVGCHYCDFLAGVGERFGKRVELHGITLAKPFSLRKMNELIQEEVKGKDIEIYDAVKLDRIRMHARKFQGRVKRYGLNVHVGQAETHRYGKKFDLIVSSVAMLHSLEPLRLLENTLNHLAVGGEAFLDMGSEYFFEHYPDLRETLKEQGIEAKQVIANAFSFKRIGRKKVKISQLEQKN